MCNTHRKHLLALLQEEPGHPKYNFLSDSAYALRHRLIKHDSLVESSHYVKIMRPTSCFEKILEAIKMFLLDTVTVSV